MNTYDKRRQPIPKPKPQQSGKADPGPIKMRGLSERSWRERNGLDWAWDRDSRDNEGRLINELLETKNLPEIFRTAEELSRRRNQEPVIEVIEQSDRDRSITLRVRRPDGTYETTKLGADELERYQPGFEPPSLRRLQELTQRINGSPKLVAPDPEEYRRILAEMERDLDKSRERYVIIDGKGRMRDWTPPRVQAPTFENIDNAERARVETYQRLAKLAWEMEEEAKEMSGPAAGATIDAAERIRKLAEEHYL